MPIKMPFSKKALRYLIIVYLLIGSFVNLESRLNDPGNIENDSIYYRSIVWPGILAGRFERIEERKQEQARRDATKLAEKMVDCPAGYERACEKYFSQKRAGLDRDLVSVMSQGNTPPDKEAKILVGAMARFCWAPRMALAPSPVDKVLKDTEQFATSETDSWHNFVGAYILHLSIEHHYLRTWSGNGEKINPPGITVRQLEALLAMLERAAAKNGRALLPSPGLGNLYEALAAADPERRPQWEAKALDAYRDAILLDGSRFELKHALHGFVRLEKNSAARHEAFRKLKDVQKRSYGTSYDPSWDYYYSFPSTEVTIDVLWMPRARRVIPGVGTIGTPEGWEINEGNYPLWLFYDLKGAYSDPEEFVEDLYYLLPAIGGPDMARAYLSAAYQRSGMQETVWLDLLQRILHDHFPGAYEGKRQNYL